MEQEERTLVDSIKERIQKVVEQINNEEVGSQRYKELVNELKTLSGVVKSEAEFNANDIEQQRVDMENAMNSVNIKQHEDDEKRNVWLTLVTVLVPALFSTGLGLLAMKFEIFNVIPGKANWEAIKNVMNGKF